MTNIFIFSDPIEETIPAENVIVPESGEESEDEWKYIKVNQDTNENETQERIINLHETSESQNICPDVRNCSLFEGSFLNLRSKFRYFSW